MTDRFNPLFKTSVNTTKYVTKKVTQPFRKFGGMLGSAFYGDDHEQPLDAGHVVPPPTDAKAAPAPADTPAPSPRVANSPPGNRIAASPGRRVGGRAPVGGTSRERTRPSGGARGESPRHGSGGGGKQQTSNERSVLDDASFAEPVQISMEPVPAFYDRITRNGCKGVLEEYTARVRPYLPDINDMAAFNSNPEKNRYKDVKCLDSSRVKLSKESPTDSDYIHANFIGSRIICTQGPLANTAIEFWAMVYQQKCQCIIMLCKTTENNRSKCLDYWPTVLGETMQFGCYTIRLTKENLKRPDDQKPTKEKVNSVLLELQKAGDVETPPRPIVHHQWISWPDKGVPSDGYMAVHLLNSTAHYKEPVVIHCSAGIGRTGLLVVLNQCLEWIDSPADGKQPLDVAEDGFGSDKPIASVQVTRAVRRQRAHCVQTDLQYLLVHKVLLDYCVAQELVRKSPGHHAFDQAYQALATRIGPPPTE